MLPFNRVYTAAELRAMSRLTPTGPQPPVGAGRAAGVPARVGSRRTLITVWQRLLGRGGARRPAPGTI
ncbi:MAG: hypothetical protein AB1679_07875 [Actinomycetota bacterium]|jgi:hypothetical protein